MWYSNSAFILRIEAYTADVSPDEFIGRGQRVCVYSVDANQLDFSAHRVYVTEAGPELKLVPKAGVDMLGFI